MTTTGLQIALVGLAFAWLRPTAIAHLTAQPLPMLDVRGRAPVVLERIEQGDGGEYAVTSTAVRLPIRESPTLPTLGEENRRCVEVTERAMYRSGEFIVGGNLPEVVPNRMTKIWWMPLKRTPGMSLQVRAARLGAPADTLRFHTDYLAWPVPNEYNDSFFPWGMEFPRPGRWVLVGTSNSNWGCFVITVSET